ncbi:hypothetical protein I551_7411 [Mycobacterium ulcerans str. Harvey]|uniref:Uncharacterized protein n=1 Tax=Mycobacterium ulcerans str. Harvey TaxID=1299332 RepID=A0ABN0QNM8_MYCUL|nr:hypothetical protein I551_7411 [Mycobacterium ulcerans str. Harvey]
MFPFMDCLSLLALSRLEMEVGASVGSSGGIVKTHGLP